MIPILDISMALLPAALLVTLYMIYFHPERETRSLYRRQFHHWLDNKAWISGVPWLVALVLYFAYSTLRELYAPHWPYWEFLSDWLYLMQALTLVILAKLHLETLADDAPPP